MNKKFQEGLKFNVHSPSAKAFEASKHLTCKLKINSLSATEGRLERLAAAKTACWDSRWEFYHCVGHPLVQEPSQVVHFRKWGAQLIVQQVISLWPLEERRFVPFFPVAKDPGTAQIVIHYRHALPCCRHRSELKSFGTGVFPAVKRVVFHTCSWATSYAWKPKQSICPPNPPPTQLLRW